MVTTVIGVLVAVIVGFRWHSGLEISALSLVLPALALAWLTLLGFQIRRHHAPMMDPGATAERPSRRPPQWDSLPRANRESNHPGPPGQVSA